MEDKFTCSGGFHSTSSPQPVVCNCAPGHPSFGSQFLAAKPDGSMASSQCGGANCAQAEPQVCDGKTSFPFPEDVDPGCGDDDHTCTGAFGEDDHPVNLSSGRVEINPITLFSLPTPEGIDFGLTLKYASHYLSAPGIKRLINGVQDTISKIHHSDETIHFYGMGWLDNFSDRLYFLYDNQVLTRVTWRSMRGIVTFKNTAGWKSTSGKYELVNRLNPTDGLGQWVIQTTDTQAPRKTWAFEEVTFTTLENASETITRLKRHSLTKDTITATTTTIQDFYGFTVSWTADSTIEKVVDTLSRELQFTYASLPSGCSGTACSYRIVTGLRYKPHSSSPTTYDAATISYAYDGQVLDRVSQVGSGTYKRFLYWQPTSTCPNCSKLMSDVIVPGTSGTAPGPQAPVLADEVVLEHHDFTIEGTLGMRPRAIGSRGPSRHYAYVWQDGSALVTQLDLNQPTGTCALGCDADSQCYSGTCYFIKSYEWDANFRRPQSESFLSGVSGGGGGGTPKTTHDISYSGMGSPTGIVDSAGVRTTTGLDTKGRLRCLVRDDDDTEAFQTPTAPDTSACAGPAGAQIVRVDYAGLTITKTTPGILGAGDVVETQTLDPNTLYLASNVTVGKTRDLAGSNVNVTKTATRTYCSDPACLGRLEETNGPLADAVALDKTRTEYYTAFDPSWPHNFGRVQRVKRYVGNSTSNIELTTVYAEYDLFGVPHRVTGPNGDYVTYSASADRLTWTITHFGVGGGTIGTSITQFNGDGTVRFMQDADGVCLTYEYRDAGGYVGAPTKIRRSNTSCGALPIATNDGEVEIRTYVSSERDRLQSVARLSDGVSQFTYSGFTYDRERRLTNATTLDSATPYTFGFTDDLPSSTVAPGAPAAGSWRTDTTADDFGRPTSLLRFIDASNKQTYNFSYATPFTPRPTQLSRGYNGSSTSVTTFVYDDFGRLVQTTVPEAGAPGSPAPTRYEYDVGDRMITKRVGIGTAGVRTSSYSYDSLGRTTAVDHDTEHPVDCASAADGTPIQDEEYRYDNCTGDVPSGFSCNNALGKRTISRAILQCSSGQVIKRGRWYDYDTAGRVSRVGYATVTGSMIGAVATSEMSYTSANRLSSWTNPITSVYGTGYTFDARSGRPQTVTTSALDPITNGSIAYRAFGPLAAIDMRVMQPAGGDTRILKLRPTYRSDDSIGTLNWRLEGTSSTIHLINQTMGYGSAGALSDRTDSADMLSSRYYGYDSLLRLKCEARGTSTAPSSSDCVTTSSKLAGLFTYGDGESATSPPDVRKTSFIKGAGTSGASYTSPSTETYTYSSGSGQTQQINRTGSNIVIGYDTLGRRTFEYQSTSATLSRRDYTYLPNGQLGKVTGRDLAGQRYTIEVRYDEEGRPLTIASGTDAYELFWDDANRLTGVVITGGTTVSWHYHYLGSTLIAATRVIPNPWPQPPSVKRFWAVTDERGLIYRWLDEQGATFWQARWDASGWRQIVGTPQPNMWVPFALPKQVAIEGTAASAGGNTVRPNITLNTKRAYDPVLGAFLVSDAKDQAFRLGPEGYYYGRNNPVGLLDATGDSSEASNRALALLLGQTLGFDASCSLVDREQLTNAVASAIGQIQTCTSGECGLPGGENVRRKWIAALFRETYYCPKKDGSYPYLVATDNLLNTLRGHAVAWTFPEDEFPNSFMSPASLGGFGCMAQHVAHEALHWVHYNTDAAWLFIGTADPAPCATCLTGLTIAGMYGDKKVPLPNGADPVDLEELQVQRTTHGADFGGCVKCPTKK